MSRVVITGIGAVTPLGNTFQESWEAAIAGRTGIGPITRFDAGQMRWKVAGELRGFDPGHFLGPKELRRTDPFVHYAVAAAVMAAEDAGLIRTNREKTGSYVERSVPASYLGGGGVIMGSSRGGIITMEQAMLKSSTLAERGGKSPFHVRPSPYLMPATTTGMAASYSARVLGTKGNCLGISNACSSGLNAVGEAFRLLRNGYGGPLLAGGSEAPICRTCVEGYGISGALSRREDFSASRPFTRTRDGFVLAEGACVLVLERLESAEMRNARVYGEIAGYANRTDALHQTRPDMRGEAVAIRQAIAEAGVLPEEIDYVNAHGTSTPLGDKAEAKALSLVLKDRTSYVPVSALKSMTGHMLAASGALETALTAMTLREGIIPPTLNVPEQDDCCHLFVTRETTQKKMRLAITNSFGFGGVNAVVVLKAFP